MPLLFPRSRRAVAAAREVRGSASEALDLYESMWKPPPAAYTITPSDIPGLIGGAFGLDAAMSVPAFARGMHVITGIGSSLPLVDLDPATGGPLPRYGLTAAPTMWIGHTDAELWRRTIADLVCHGHAVWAVIASNEHGHPTSVHPVEDARCEWYEWGCARIDGRDVLAAEDPRRRLTWIDGKGHGYELLTFSTGLPGALTTGWGPLSTALSLETAARNYASAPLPATALHSKGLDLEPEDAQELLAAWEAARRTRSTAYLNTQVDLETFGWNAAELQLTEARSHAAIEVARLLNLDPYFVGASAGGSSYTYQNRTDLYQSLLDFTVMPLLRVIEQRLSMPDVCGGRRQLRFDVSSFLRANLSDRVAALTAYVGAGVITPEQARDLEPLIRRGEVPA